MEKIIFKVEGIECMGCENRIQNALNALECVQTVKADHNTQTVTVLADLSKKDIIQTTLEELGFSVIEVIS